MKLAGTYAEQWSCVYLSYYSIHSRGLAEEDAVVEAEAFLDSNLDTRKSLSSVKDLVGLLGKGKCVPGREGEGRQPLWTLYLHLIMALLQACALIEN